MSTGTSIEVFVPGEPVPQPRAKVQVLTRRDGSVVRSRNGRVATHAYTPGKRIGPWKQIVALKLREQKPAEPWDGPVELDVTFWFERTQDLERPKHAAGELLHAVRPDLDNLLKAIKDVMTDEQVWTDDGQVTDTVVRKRYVARGYQAGCRIIARPIITGQESLYHAQDDHRRRGLAFPRGPPMTITVYRAAMSSFARAVGDHRHRDALEALDAAEKAGGPDVPAWVAQARAELEAKVASNRPRTLRYGDADRVINAVCAVMGVTRPDLAGYRRSASCVMARRLVCYILRTHSTMSYPEIADALGFRSHSAVFEAVDAFDAMRANPSAKCQVRLGNREMSIEHPRVAIAAIEAELGLAVK